MNKFSIALALAALSGTVGLANAASTNARFGGAVNNSCTLGVASDGTMAPNIDSNVLSSNETGGAASTVSALSTAAGFRVSAIAPAGFSSAPVGAAATFAATYAVSGVTTIGTTAGATTSTIGRGAHTVTVNLAATSTAGVFPNGAYEAIVTVRCE